MTTSRAVATSWVESYVHAWRTEDPLERAKVLKTLFVDSAESFEWPYETHWAGIREIIDGWARRTAWQVGRWDFEWTVLAINGDTFVVRGLARYAELGTFDNLWVVTLDETTGQCLTFRMFNNQVDDAMTLDLAASCRPEQPSGDGDEQRR